MDFLAEIFQGDQNQEYVHQRFVKYGKGEFKGPAATIKKGGKDVKISGTYEYVNTVLETMLRNSNGTVEISGGVFAHKEVKAPFVSKPKKKLGLFIHEAKGEVDAKELLAAYEENKEGNFLLTLQGDGIKLKAKKKPPKPGSAPDPDFFTATVPGSMYNAIVAAFCFDAPNTDSKEIKISHTYTINEFAIPDEYKKDPLKARLHAKRKGRAKRTIDADGKKIESEKDLLA